MSNNETGIKVKLSECRQWQKSHETSLSKAKNQVLVGWFDAVSSCSHNKDCFDVVTEFLLTAGQSQLLSQVNFSNLTNKHLWLHSWQTDIEPTDIWLKVHMAFFIFISSLGLALGSSRAILKLGLVSGSVRAL